MVAFIPTPFLFHVFGSRLRKYSIYAPSDLQASMQKADDWRRVARENGSKMRSIRNLST